MFAAKVTEIDLRDCQRGNLTPIIMAVDSGADVNKADRYGNTPLTAATQWRKINVIQYLLELPEIESDKPDSYGSSPLIIAAKNGDSRAVAALLAKGDADVNRKDRDGLASIHYAIGGWRGEDSEVSKSDRLSVVAALINYPETDINLADPASNTPLQLATRLECLEMVKMLTKKNPSAIMTPACDLAAARFDTSFDAGRK